MSEAHVTAALIVIGNEILSGRTKDVNVAYLARQLTALGIQLAEVRMVRDEERAIIAAVNTLRASHNYVFTTGGIGPTHDDITCEAGRPGLQPALPHQPGGEAHSRGLLQGHRARAERGTDAHGAHARGRHADREPGEPGAGLPGRERLRAGRHPGGDARDVRERGADAEGRAHGEVARDRGAAGRGRRGRPARRPAGALPSRWRSAATPSSATATSARRWCCAAPTRTRSPAPQTSSPRSCASSAASPCRRRHPPAHIA